MYGYGEALERADPAVDGRTFLRSALRFGRELRAAGLTTDLAAVIDFARALGLIEIGQREEVRAAGAALFVRRRADVPTYDRVFDRFWRRQAPFVMAPTALHSEPPPRPREPPQTDGSAAGGLGEPSRSQPRPTGIEAGTDEEPDLGPEGMVISPRAYSATEALRHKEFDRMTSTELRDAERLIDLLEPRLELRRTRRQELHTHGRLLAPRVMFRRNLATGGNLVDWVWRRPRVEPRSIVVICDISGSMERHSRLLLRFVQALARARAVRAEAFVFGTHLTRVTRELRDRNPDSALQRVAAAVTDWSGGTRIGDSFHEFNVQWARRVLRSSGVVIVVSDGWDRGRAELVAEETARLQRNCHRLVWLNPLAGAVGYQPLAAGMAAAFPFIDDFLPVHNLASLERLGGLLGGHGGGRRAARPFRRAGLGATAAKSEAGLRASSGQDVAPGPARKPQGQSVWLASQLTKQR